jgi:hypothetical protein
MKKIICTILIGMTINCAFAQTTHEWKVTLKVVDDDGQPVTSANAGVGYYTNRVSASINGLTDTNGIFMASHSSYGGELGFAAEKAGYYTIRIPYLLGFDYNATKWNPVQTLVLKKIVKPIPMYAKRINSEPPANDAPVGYDLIVGDWVGPYGKGINSDIIFTREYNKKSLQDYDYKLTVSFPKAGDGIQEFPVPYKNMEGSGLRSPHEAPTNGYQSQIVRLNMSHPGQKLIFDYDENRVYLFRVRTAIDDRGNIVSAYYGKIYGDFMQFNYYFNPTPNSRNIEFDPKQNLMANLKPTEGVSAP